MQTNNRIYSVVVSKDGRWIVTGDKGRKAIVWNATTHEKVLELIEHEREVCAVDISSDCTRMVSVGGSTIRIASFPSGTRLLPPITQSCVFGVKFSPDSSRFATIAVRRGFRVYNTHDGVILFSSGPGDLVCKWPATNPLAWSSDSQHLFVANPGETTCLDLSKSSSSVWSIHETHPRVSLVSNGRFIACSAGSSVSFWDCVSHKQIDSMISHTTEIYCTALSPSGRLLACGGSKNVTIHRVRDVLSPEYFDHGLPLVQRRLLAPQVLVTMC